MMNRGMTNRRPPQRRPLPTLYKTHDDMKTALLATIDALSGKTTTLPKNEEGFQSIDQLTKYLQDIHPQLQYINRNHIVELYFRDRDRKILINDLDNIKYKEVKYVQPPDSLYFGTLENLAERMRTYGLKSGTKGYIKLYAKPEVAAEFGKKFADRGGDKVVVLKVDAGRAFSDGMRFSTFKEGEYIIVRVDRRYILEEVPYDE